MFGMKKTSISCTNTTKFQRRRDKEKYFFFSLFELLPFCGGSLDHIISSVAVRPRKASCFHSPKSKLLCNIPISFGPGVRVPCAGLSFSCMESNPPYLQNLGWTNLGIDFIGFVTLSFWWQIFLSLWHLCFDTHLKCLVLRLCTCRWQALHLMVYV